MAVIDPTSLSFNQVKQDLIDFLDSKLDVESSEAEAWKDYIRDASTGGMIVELIAGLAVFGSYHTIVGRRESYLYSATKRSSIIAIAQILGYSAGRGQKQHYNLTITPTTTGALQKYAVIGQASGLDVVLLEEVIVNDGTQTTVSVVFGDLITENITVGSATEKFFRFTSASVSEDLRILLNGSEVTSSSDISDLSDDIFVHTSNPLGAVDVFYLNQDNRYTTGDEISIQFVEFGDEASISLSDIELNDASADALAEDTDESRIEKESVSSIRTNAPLEHETQKVIRARDDYEKIFLGLQSSIVSTSGQDFSEAQMEITYVKNDESLFTVDEKNAFVDSLSAFRPFGVAPPVISDPVKIEIDLKVDVTTLDDVVLPPNTTTLVEDLIEDNYEKELEITLDLGGIENIVNQLTNSDENEFVKTNRVSATTTWESDTFVGVGHIIIPTTANGFYYKSAANTETKWQASTTYDEGDRIISTGNNGYGTCFEVQSVVSPSQSGSVEPDWDADAPNPGDALVDNDVTWENIGPVVPLWDDERTYSVGDLVSPNTWDSVDDPVFAGSGTDDLSTSGSYTEPLPVTYEVEIDSTGTPDTFQWSRDGVVQQQTVSITGTIQQLERGVNINFGSTTGHTLGDKWTFNAHKFFWKRINNVTDNWQADVSYAVGDRVVPVTANGYLFEATAAGTSGSSEPTWPTTVGDTVDDGGVTWKNIGTVIETWEPTRSYNLGDVIESLDPADNFFECTTAGTSGSIEPTWDTTIGNTTSDGTVEWTAITGGESDTSEPTWLNREGYTVADNTILWEAVKIFTTSDSEPSFSTTEGILTEDGAVLWENIGSTDDPITTNWNEYFSITVTTNVN